MLIMEGNEDSSLYNLHIVDILVQAIMSIGRVGYAPKFA